MSTIKRDDFSRFGKDFQESLCHLVLKDRPFADQIFEVLDMNFFEQKYLQVFVFLVKEYREEFLNAKNGRVAIRRDFDANIIANNTVFSARLDTMDKDLKEMYRALNKMNVNLTEVKAKLDIMINKP